MRPRMVQRPSRMDAVPLAMRQHSVTVLNRTGLDGSWPEIGRMWD
jgi:hypothetical protein